MSLKNGRALITGGAGFIGSNLADRLATAGVQVTVYDNLSRAGVENNLNWLRQKHGKLIEVEVADVRDAKRLMSAVKDVKRVFHFAAQVAVTSSLTHPRHDYEVNLEGTLNVLEAIRCHGEEASLVFTSTNKVYGDLPSLQLRSSATRYEVTDPAQRFGISEETPLSFHSPYGCSKGAADQYVLDYARSFGILAVVFRMSCIYGPHQMGNEDQGWVAHFIKQAMRSKPVTICGDGLQVRDILYVEDLLDAMLLAQNHIDKTSGKAFNIGGGPENTISLVELLKLLEALSGKRVRTVSDGWRRGDQRYYVSDIRKFCNAVGWRPKVRVEEGIRRLAHWIKTEGEPMPALKVEAEHAVLAG